MKIKVCGITREEDIVKLLDLRVDFIGFNLLNESKRKVGRPNKKVCIYGCVEERIQHIS